MADDEGSAPLLARMCFQLPFRKYQSIILGLVGERLLKDNKFHIVAPPGSGKTIVGLELIRMLGKPALVLSPTTTIQAQWFDKLKLFFSPQDGGLQREVASLSPKRLAPINIFTYQLLSTPGENLEFIEGAAVSRWKQQLVADGVAATEEDAEARVEAIRKSNPDEYRKEIARNYKRVKDAMLRDPAFDGSKLLHANARALIDALAEAGVEVIVLDECHHLLDYWALIIKELVRRMKDPKVIGLTATLPSTGDEEEMENYTALLGDVDFEVPTPPVVKDGYLAPYKDLAYFVCPTPAEMQFLRNAQAEFQSLAGSLSEDETFRSWVKKRVLERTRGEAKAEWSEFLKEEPLVAIAGLKFIKTLGGELPPDVYDTEDALSPLSIEDWANLLEDYGLHCLKVSERESDHAALSALKASLKPFGFTLTERGMLQQRSPGDNVLALSDAKSDGAVNILRAESGANGDALRALVVTDYEKMSAPAKRLPGVLDPDAGSAVRAFRKIVAHPETNKLNAILATGTTMLVDADIAEEVLAQESTWMRDNGHRARMKATETAYPGIVQITGEGPDWKPSVYVALATHLFDRGVTRCLVGTRGIFGEGWDSLPLNTLVDLTNAATSTTVQQIRGRTIRLDPNTPHKVAHNWDVVCISQEFEKGDRDLTRWMKKHAHHYGIAKDGKIVRGIGKVVENLPERLGREGFKKIDFSALNLGMLKFVNDRGKTYDLWGVGKPYQNFEFVATRIEKADWKFKTVYTLGESLKSIFRNIVAGLLGLAFGGYILLQLPTLVGLALAVAVSLPVIVYTAKRAHTYFRKAFIEIPVDSYILDIAKATLMALKDARLVSTGISTDNIRVTEADDGTYSVWLEYGTLEDSRTFSTCIREVLSPVRNPRYLVFRDERSLSLSFYSPFWYILRSLTSFLRGENCTAYHPVPEVLGMNKERAESFARHWNRFVGGGELVYARSDAGANVIVSERRKRVHGVKTNAFETWV